VGLVVLAAASGRLPPMVVEVVPNRLLLYCCPRRSSFFSVLLASQHGPRRDDDGDCKAAGARRWVASLVEHFGSFGVWFLGGREKSHHLNTDVVTLAGVALPS
jgi:hypothetical protein